MRVAKAHAGRKKKICPMPPPTRKLRRNSPRKTVRPCLPGRNQIDQTTIASPTIIDNIPVIMKLGMMVNAGSVPAGQNLCASPIASNRGPLVGVLPCRSSKNPWFTPENNPKNTPMVVAVTRVAFSSEKDVVFIVSVFNMRVLSGKHKLSIIHVDAVTIVFMAAQRNPFSCPRPIVWTNKRTEMIVEGFWDHFLLSAIHRKIISTCLTQLIRQKPSKMCHSYWGATNKACIIVAISKLCIGDI